MGLMSGLYRLGQYLHIHDPSVSYWWYERDKSHIRRLKKKFRQNAPKLHFLQYACDISMDSRDCDGYVASYRRVAENVQNKWEDRLDHLRDNGLMVTFHYTKTNDQCRLMVAAQDIYTGDFVYPRQLLGQGRTCCQNENFYQLR